MFRYSEDGLIIPDKLLEKEEDTFFDIQKWRIERDRSNIIVLVGEQGSGKSNTGLYLIEKGNRDYYGKEIDFDKFVYNNIYDFVKAFKNLKECYVLLEEMGIELNSKDWRHITNRVFRDIIETFRIKKVNLVLTLPNLCDLDKSTRFLSHFIIKMIYPGRAIIFRKIASFLTDNIFFMPVWNFENIPNMREYNPELWEKYDKFHHGYIDKKNKEWLDDLQFQELKKNYKMGWYKQRAGIYGYEKKTHAEKIKEYKEYERLKKEN